MNERHNCHVYEIERVNNFKEMIDRSCEKYKDHVAYKYKINLGKENQEIIEKTYKLLDTLDNSEVIKKLTKYKKILIQDEEVLSLVKKINNFKTFLYFFFNSMNTLVSELATP